MLVNRIDRNTIYNVNVFVGIINSNYPGESA